MDRVQRVDALLKPDRIKPIAKPLDYEKRATQVTTPFSQFFGAALQNINAASDTVKFADRMTVGFATGVIDNPEDVMIAQEKASLSINYATKITNKILDVYNEIMRMQI